MAVHFLNRDGSVKSVEYVGCVLQVKRCVSVRIMSDVWGSADEALVWDTESQKPKTVEIRFCDYNWDSDSYAEVDATNDVKLAYKKYLIQSLFQEYVGKAQSRASRIEKGAIVEVMKGRKVKKGTKGKVVVMLQQSESYGYSRRIATKLGIATSDEMIEVVKNGKVFKNHKDMVWVWEHYCNRLDCEEIDKALIMSDVIEEIDEKMERMFK